MFSLRWPFIFPYSSLLCGTSSFTRCRMSWRILACFFNSPFSLFFAYFSSQSRMYLVSSVVFSSFIYPPPLRHPSRTVSLTSPRLTSVSAESSGDWRTTSPPHYLLHLQKAYTQSIFMTKDFRDHIIYFCKNIMVCTPLLSASIYIQIQPTPFSSTPSPRILS
jgi:hypothetical protein